MFLVSDVESTYFGIVCNGVFRANEEDEICLHSLVDCGGLCIFVKFKIGVRNLSYAANNMALLVQRNL